MVLCRHRLWAARGLHCPLRACAFPPGSKEWILVFLPDSGIQTVDGSGVCLDPPRSVEGLAHIRAHSGLAHYRIIHLDCALWDATSWIVSGSIGVVLLFDNFFLRWGHQEVVTHYWFPSLDQTTIWTIWAMGFLGSLMAYTLIIWCSIQSPPPSNLSTWAFYCWATSLPTSYKDRISSSLTHSGSRPHLSHAPVHVLLKEADVHGHFSSNPGHVSPPFSNYSFFTSPCFMQAGMSPWSLPLSYTDMDSELLNAMENLQFTEEESSIVVIEEAPVEENSDLDEKKLQYGSWLRVPDWEPPNLLRSRWGVEYFSTTTMSEMLE
ncbi:hypothetical protein V6N12_020148 [Hibiscus sabdariffa]|uniref:Uncharacterized protein n=1 Tax=Hibiscus sabdariffa TaxID=183260 RepID=A0ABR1ZYI5_9ROSI